MGDVTGERRWRAAQQAEMHRIPAIVRQTDDVDMLRDALLELAKETLIEITQAEAFAPIYVRLSYSPN